MDFWTQLKKSGQEAAGKAKDLAEVTKLQLAQKEQERKLEQLYAQLGKCFYEKAVQEEGAVFPDLLQSITQTLEEIEACKEQQLLIKGGVRCATCGTLMETDVMFCPSCGAPLPEKTAAVPPHFSAMASASSRTSTGSRPSAKCSTSPWFT